MTKIVVHYEIEYDQANWATENIITERMVNRLENRVRGAIYPKMTITGGVSVMEDDKNEAG